ncbi:hypothetical protein GOP47_0006654, partial [Adiantum capillus-veneris]
VSRHRSGLEWEHSLAGGGAAPACEPALGKGSRPTLDSAFLPSSSKCMHVLSACILGPNLAPHLTHSLGNRKMGVWENVICTAHIMRNLITFCKRHASKSCHFHDSISLFSISSMQVRLSWRELLVSL